MMLIPRPEIMKEQLPLQQEAYQTAATPEHARLGIMSIAAVLGVASIVAVLHGRKPTHEDHVGTKQALDKAAADRAAREARTRETEAALAAARKSRQEASAINKAQKARLAEFRASRRPPGT